MKASATAKNRIYDGEFGAWLCLGSGLEFGGRIPSPIMVDGSGLVAVARIGIMGRIEVCWDELIRISVYF